MNTEPQASSVKSPSDEASAVVVGLGKSGLSLARFLAARQQAFVVLDTRDNPPGLAELHRILPQIEVRCGELDVGLLAGAGEIFLSPGLSPQLPALVEARRRGVKLSGDIQLFIENAAAPVVAITGSNGKSTVTTLLGEMAKTAGRRVAVGGNLGVPALDLLDPAVELYVLELSSFQLELVEQLNAEVATILNLSEDHMDRYADLPAYRAAKQRIYAGARQILINRQEPSSAPEIPAADTTFWSFGLDAPAAGQFGILSVAGRRWLAYQSEPLLATDELRIRGTHNQANALAALSLGHAVGLPWAAMLQTLREFPGLPHRCQWVGERAGVRYFNDSKATNVGAALAAIQGLGADIEGRLLLIAGGDGKGADFSSLAAPVAEYCRAVVLIGRDADRLAGALGDATDIRFAGSLEQAVTLAAELARPGDAVLLSPACASWDMFSDFEARGQRFCAAVGELATC